MNRTNLAKIVIIVAVILAATGYVYYRTLDLQVGAGRDGAVDGGARDAVMDEPGLVDAPAAEAVPEVPAEIEAVGEDGGAAQGPSQGTTFFLKKARESKEAGDRAKACEYAREAIGVAKADHETWLFEGYCALEDGKPQGAVKAFGMARAPGAERLDLAVIGLAESFRRQNKIKTALKYYEAYLVEFPDGPDAAIAEKYAKAIAACLESDKGCKPDLRKPAPLSFW